MDTKGRESAAIFKEGEQQKLLLRAESVRK